MASLSLSSATYNYGGSCTATISGFQDPWNQANYIEAGVSTQPVSNGSSSYPSGTVGNTMSPSSGSSTSVSFSVRYLGSGSITLYGWAQTNEGLYYSCGSDSIYIPSEPPPDPAPPVQYKPFC